MNNVVISLSIEKKNTNLLARSVCGGGADGGGGGGMRYVGVGGCGM